MSDSTTQLHEAMERLSIAVPVEYVCENRAGTGAWTQPHHLYRFHLDVNGERLISNGSYKTGVGHAPGSATPVDVFGSILSDCACVEPYANDDAEEERNVWPQTRSEWPPRWDEWADDLGFFSGGHPGRGELRRLANDFREIMSRRALLRDRVGFTAYDQLLEIAAEL